MSKPTDQELLEYLLSKQDKSMEELIEEYKTEKVNEEINDLAQELTEKFTEIHEERCKRVGCSKCIYREPKKHLCEMKSGIMQMLDNGLVDIEKAKAFLGYKEKAKKPPVAKIAFYPEKYKE